MSELEKNELIYYNKQRPFLKRKLPKENLVILIVGSENSGKSSLIRNLAEQMNLILVKECKRSFFKTYNYILRDVRYLASLKTLLLKNYAEKEKSSSDVNKAKKFSENTSNTKKTEVNNTTGITENISTITNSKSKNIYSFHKKNSKSNEDNNYFCNLHHTDFGNENEIEEEKIKPLQPKNYKKLPKNIKEENVYEGLTSNNNNKISEDVCISIEFREISSDELYSEYQMCTVFYENASFALIVANYEYNESFIE